MQKVCAHLVLFFLIGFCALIQAKPASPVTRILYANDPHLMNDAGEPLQGLAREERLQLLREAYGTDLHVIDYVNGKPPAKPVHIPGLVIHIDTSSSTGDQLWVVGDKNPVLEFQGVRQHISKRFPDIIDIDEKYDGYRFIKKVVPDNAAPEMKLATEFTQGDLSQKQLAEIEKHVDETLKKYGSDPENVGLRNRAIEVAKVKERINQDLGTSFVKVRDLNHSEGKLPKSSKDWVDLYVRYALEVKPKVLEAEERSVKEGISLPELLVEIEGAEGRVLDKILEEPSNIIVQRKIDIHREVRTHRIEGQLLSLGGTGTDDATFLRFYELNQYLPDYERQAFQEFYTEVFAKGLKKMGIDPNRWSFTPDLVIEKRKGLEEAIASAKKGNYRALFPFIRVLDENIGFDSGYTYPGEDLFTTGYLFKRYTGKNTKFLDEIEEFKALPLGKSKSDRLKQIRKKYEIFFRGDVEEAFWDRINDHYLDVLQEDPSPKSLNTVLQEMRRGGLKTETVYVQFLNKVQDTHPDLHLSQKDLSKWLSYFNFIEPDIKTILIGENKRFHDVEVTDPVSCKVLKVVGAKNH